MRTKALLHVTTCADCKREDPPIVKTAIATISIDGIPRGFCFEHLTNVHSGHSARVRKQIEQDPAIEAIIQELMLKGKIA